MEKKKQYKSLGQMMKAGDFESLLDDLIKMKESGELKDFSKTTEQKPISEFDDLLFFFPQYCSKKLKEEGKEEVLTNELHPKAMEFLEFAIQNGANPNAYMRNGENCFLKSCEIKNTEVLEYLINNKHNTANVNHGDGMGNNALFYATMAESEEAIDYLVNICGFDVNHKNFLTNNETCLHYACGHKKEKSFDKLISLGADPSIKDAYGYQPYEMMLAAYDEETIEEFDLNDPEDKAELDSWKNFYEKAKKITTDYKEKNPKKLKTKF